MRRTIGGARAGGVYHLAGAPHVGQSWKAATETLAVNVLATHSPARGAARSKALRSRVVVPSSAYVYRPADRALTEDDPIESTNPYAISKIATELAAARAARRRRHPGRRRPVVQPHRPAAGSVVLRVRRRAADRAHRGGPARAGHQGRQPRHPARLHRRARHGPRVPRAGRTRRARPRLQRVLGPGAPDARPARRARRPRARAGDGRAGPGPLPPERHAPAARRPVAHPERDGLGAARAASSRRCATCSTTGGAPRERVMKVLVTGGTGYLGRAVVGALRRLRARRGALREDGQRRPGFLPRPIDGDIRDAAGLATRRSGCDAILHSAALVATWRRRSRDFDDVNVGGLRACSRPPAGRHPARPLHVVVPRASAGRAGRRAGVERLPAHEGGRRQPGGRGRAAGRAACPPVPRRHLRPRRRRPTATWSAAWWRTIWRARLPGVIGGDRIWSFSFVEDVAAAHVAALQAGAPGARYLLGGEDAPQMRVFDIVQRLTGRPLPRRMPGWLRLAGGARRRVARDVVRRARRC